MRKGFGIISSIKKRITKIDCNSIPLEVYGSEYGGFGLCNIYKEKDKVIVYSFGIGEDLSFSEDVLTRLDMSEIYAFDPTPKSIEYVKKHHLYRQERFHFFDYGLSDKCGEVMFYLPENNEYVSGSTKLRNELKRDGIIVKMQDIGTLAKELQHNHIDILKMDIEGSEFRVISSLKNYTKWLTIDQVCLETHERFDNWFVSVLKLYLLNRRMHRMGYCLVYKEEDDYTYLKKNYIQYNSK